MHKRFLTWGALLAGLAVALGAFGAHGLKKLVPPETVATFETGVKYQMYHALALLLAGLIAERLASVWLKRAAWCFLIGILLFSGSLYLLTALKATDSVGLGGLGIITPIGGVFFIAGWISLAVGVRSLKV
ncbi:MAG: DUF423 domain-containing protein [Sphingobacteriales bacterium]|jgi:uncharacterized membrane protein YgdD (TMEM256/DUF423 family)|nr:DUF423 domain-containing protein [Sphingobacteriales bacterium]NCT73855.1 DUF423 domain-containing protein [Chitinophagaceae bacterium]OJW30465.1 MAG: hypothetical protein BGO54_21550 [Sphingobacteriales bacterium 46-32]